MRKRPGWVGQVQLRSRSRSTTTTVKWEGTDFLVLMKVKLDARVFNTLIIFISPPSTSLLSPSGDVAINICGS